MSLLTELWYREKVYERIEIDLAGDSVRFQRFEWSCNDFMDHGTFSDMRDYAEFARFVPLWFTNLLYKCSSGFNNDFAIDAMDRIEKAIMDPESARTHTPRGLLINHPGSFPKLLVEIFIGSKTQRVSVKGVRGETVWEMGSYEVLAILRFIEATHRTYPEGMLFLANEFAYLRAVANNFGIRELIALKSGSARAVQSAGFAFNNTAMG
jgi:hypothetical protein